MGWENLDLQGPYGDSLKSNDAFFAALAGGAPWDDVQHLLLASAYASGKQKWID